MKNVFVTGVSKGLGIEIVKACLKKEYRVWGVSRSKTEDLEKLMEEYPGQLFWKQFDLHDIEKIKDDLFNNFLNLDIPVYGFINNAAMAYDDIITNLNTEYLEKMYRINTFAPMIITKYVIRNMLLHQTRGAIIHVSSISAHTGYKGLAMYASSKGALEAFSKNTAREWGERGIRSNCIVAGFMDTDMSAKLDKARKERIYRRTALKKPADPVSVAHMAEYLLSERAASITGQNLFVDSGTI